MGRRLPAPPGTTSLRERSPGSRRPATSARAPRLRAPACAVRAALAGGPLDGVLIRVAQTGALDEARDVARKYAERARACLNGELHRGELEALTYAVVERRR